MEKTLDLYFLTEEGKTARLTVNDPKEDLTGSEIKAAMDQIVSSGVFFSTSGSFVSAKEARLVERNVVSIELE
ncbi:DUF2922 domain-containing protein [Fervidibacillus halotolerans]|uniref:DUF2922 domain-containing protein n=1 Tax=Fervidibacillus halotolerans TaxID=2980027 RepID=A0A9E8M319_9BACI|nr:DUF2922 domain-containing protein [Fervidibacillus halotolerans]WAA13494.1 DUF2922 domain-containing protein [Fervidibacillus halotolerans]